MNKNEIINSIDCDLSILLNKLNYNDYLLFIKNDKLLSFYDSIVDTKYVFLLNENILNKIYTIY